jgi:cell division protein FtsL
MQEQKKIHSIVFPPFTQIEKNLIILLLICIIYFIFSQI